MVDPYETVNCDENGQPQYVPTAKVLRHFDHEINTVLGGIEGADGQMKKARIALLAGRSTSVGESRYLANIRSQAPIWSCPWVGLVIYCVENTKLTRARRARPLGAQGPGHNSRPIRRFHH
jgi:nicotinamide mononucleotide adenylyltransferase